jgi:hypothetical protein
VCCVYRQRKGFLLLLENLKVSPRTRRGSIKSTRTETERRIKNTRSTSTVTRIEVKIRTRRKRKTKVGIMILVLSPRINTMRRKGSMTEMKILMTFTVTRKVSIRAQRLKRQAPLG